MPSRRSDATSSTVRGPGSAVGGSTTHSRRYDHPQSGGSARSPKNEFPIFSHTGDVEMVVRVRSGHERRYLLHRHILIRCSGFFEASTSEMWSRARAGSRSTGGAVEVVARMDEGGSNVADDDGTSPPAYELVPPRRRWRYELDHGSGDDDVPMLVQRDEGAHLFAGSGPTARQTMRQAKSASAPALESQPPSLTVAEEHLLRDYDNLFRIMYNYVPVLDGVHMADAYVQCKSLLRLADQYDALTVVGPRVDHHLLQFRSRLWKQIASYPISYLRLGLLARSRVIFQEAIVHVVGQWPAGKRAVRATMPDLVLDMIEDKVDELEETVGRVEAGLFRLRLTTRSGEPVSPASSYLDWLAISFFRQWLADKTTASTVATLGRTFRTLGGLAADRTFLGHDECKRFLKLTPDLYSRENVRRFEKRVDELKAMARHVVRPLMDSTLELELGPTGRDVTASIDYLTFIKVADRDLPWLASDWR